MPVDRPTFSDAWYRVSSLTPQLLSAVNVYRQHFRGIRWTILQVPTRNQYFRLNDAGYHFVAMLDGRRSVDQVWQTCMDRYGDAAPTQGEVINLLGRLYAWNLLQGDLPPDAEALFKRHQKRVWREVRGFFSRLLFIRIPLWDPDRFLDRWHRVLGRLFTWYGLLLWVGLLMAGIWSIGGRAGDLMRQTAGVLDPANLPLLYAALVIVKVLHEMGHAFSCKHFGRLSGTGGEVHRMGVTFLVFTPLPFMDATSAWALRNKWHRIVVGASGMMVELAIAAIAAMLWVHSAEGSTLNAIAYNLIFIASVSSLVFNGNPFLRYDAYYILSDLLEIPNLESRSKMYIAYLVKRHLWGVQNAHDPSHTRGERAWLAAYAVASLVCRVVVVGAIILFLGERAFLIGVLFALITFTGWILLPFIRLIQYLSNSRELDRHRARAVFSLAITATTCLVFIGLLRFPDRSRVEGVVEPREYAVIHMQTAGFVKGYLESGARTGPAGPTLITASSPELTTRLAMLRAELRQLKIKRQSAQTTDTAKVQILEEKLAALKEQIDRIDRDLKALRLQSPIEGIWVAPEIDRITGKYLPRGQRIGVVAGLNELRIRAVAGQTVAARFIKDVQPVVSMRLKGRPEIELKGRIETIIPAGQDRLPSAALGFAAGGSTRIDLKDPSGMRTAEPFFEIIVTPVHSETGRMMPGQTVVLRFETSPKPLLVQCWRALQQVFQRRFQV